MDYYLSLNKAALIFIPPQRGISQPHVTQVIVKSRRSEPTVDECAAFFGDQEEVTKAVEAIVVGHLLNPLDGDEVVVEGDGFSLHGSRRQWALGTRLDLRRGEDSIKRCQDKWIFEFTRDIGKVE